MSKFPSYRWLPKGAMPFSHGEPEGRPVGRYLGLGVATLVLMAQPLVLPRWAWLLVVAGLAVLATVAFAYGRRPAYPTTWLVHQPERIGLVRSGDEDVTGPAPATVTWLHSAETQIWQRSWAVAVEGAAERVLDAAGLADPANITAWDEDDDEPGPLPGYVLRDRRGAVGVPGYHLPPSAEDRTGTLPFEWLGVPREELPAQRHAPTITRVTFDDVRALARAGVAPAHRLEAAFGRYAQPTEADLVLELGLPRGWASILDTLPPAEVRALPVAERIAVLRAEVLAQSERDLAWERERGVAVPVTPQWTDRWLRRLDTLGPAAEAAPRLAAGAWPELSGTARTALLFAATGTDLSDRPLRPMLESFGVPTESPVERLSWGPAHRFWQVMDRVTLLACWAVVIAASSSVAFWAQS
ncbi:hypothetical protein [Crossiella sp. NPDC003009]